MYTLSTGCSIRQMSTSPLLMIISNSNILGFVFLGNCIVDTEYQEKAKAYPHYLIII
jgi:hypothetical protein